MPKPKPWPLYIVFGIALVLFAPNLIVLALSTRYYVTSDDTALAERIVREGKDVRECLKLIQIDFGPHPSNAEKRMGCIYDVAKLRKDPKSCSLLLNSTYGISCIENIVPPIEGPRVGYNCGTNETSFFCYSRIPLSSPDIVLKFEECKSYTDINRSDWCLMGRILEDRQFNDCSSVKLNQDHKDHCYYLLAQKNITASDCKKIVGQIRRSACELLIETIIKHPEFKDARLDYVRN